MCANKHLPNLLTCLLLCIGAFRHDLQAQNTPNAESITIADGLSQGMIYDIEQSDDGFLWFATKDGLNRYDGYHFEVFTNDPFNPFSIAGNDIHRMFQDSRGNLWLSIEGKGLDVMEKQSGKFLHLPLEIPPFVTETSDRVIWIGTDKHLLRLQWRSAPLDLSNSANLDAYAMVERMPVNMTAQYPAIRVEAEADGALLVSSQSGLARYSPSSGQLALLHPGALSMHCRTDKGVWALSTDAEICLVETGGLPRQLKLNLLPEPYKKSRIMPDGQGNLIISCTSIFNGSGFFRISEDELLRQGNLKQFEKVFWIDLFSPWSEVDRSGNLWVGTSGYGLRKTNLTSLPFQHLLTGVSVKQISSVNNQVCVPVTFAEELYMPETGTLLKTKALFPEVTSLLWLMECNNGAATYLLCYVGEQIMFGIVKNGQARFLKMPYSPGAFGSMFIDSKDRAWIGAVQGQLMCYLPENDRFVTFDLAGHLGNLPQTYAVYEDARHDIWAGTDNGAVKLDIGNRRFTPVNLDIGNLKQSADSRIISEFPVSKFQTDASDPQSLRNNFVTAFCPDPLEPERYIWLSTKGGGLNLLDLTTNKFEHFTNRNSGLPNDVVYGILPENPPPHGQGWGNIWGSTNRGLFRLTISRADSQQPTANRSYRFRNFRAFDGLQGDEFNTLSYFKGKDGRLYFGGVEGLTVFDPADIVERKSDAIVQFTSLKINNLDVDYAASFYGKKQGNYPLDRPLHRAESLLLGHNQSTITLDFSLMDFVNPKENRYRYRLSGADDDWVEAGVSHSAAYTNLPPGSYTFVVQGAISGGEWSKSTFLKIKVLPPWWATWWAYLLYALAGGAAIFSFYKFRLRQKIEHQEALRLRELDEFKSRFFTNITHEFRTPLTVILGNLEIEKLEIEKLGKPADAKISQFLNFLISKNTLTRRNAESLLRLINQILDLAKLESKSLKMNYVQGDVLPYLRYITESLHSYANAQNVMLRVESSEAEIVMDYDPERLLQIMHNLLSNAIKFTPSGGKVTLRAEVKGEKREVRAASPFTPQLSLLVSDTGIGIPAADLPKIFDRFYQVENQASPLGGRGAAGGTGIGLSLTKELVKAMGGEIGVESMVGKGTVFAVRLPVAQSPLTQPPDPLRGEPQLSNSAVFSTMETTRALPVYGSPFRGPGGWDRSENHDNNHLLLIEDNPDVVEYLAACLSENYNLDFAYNGRAGIEKALETVPDLIISDVMMPEKDGFEVCDFLKNDERTSHIPIILLTAKADMESRIAGLKRGADAYLAKPFHREELLVTLQNLLDLRRKLQARYSKLEIGNLEISETSNSSIPQFHNSNFEDAFLKKLRLHIEENLGDTAFDGARLAKAMNLSEVQLYRKIKALTDKSTAIYIRSIRLAKGRELLQTTKMNVSEIAYEVGFDDPNYFSRTFSQEFGMSPSDVRK
ncbi:MAG: response regulator [Lewinellaceae bacterium]|nr:response regulator [Lewinellaceae bacterium]